MFQIFYKFCPVCGIPYNKEVIERAYIQKHYICGSCRYIFYLNPKPTVGAIILNKNKLLLVKRSWYPFRGFWQLPGGFINYGETPEEALKRELKEELNMEVKILQLYHIGEDKYQNYLNEKCFEEYSFLPITYLASTQNTNIRISDDVADAKYFKLAQVPFNKIAFTNQKLLLKKFIKENGTPN